MKAEMKQMKVIDSRYSWHTMFEVVRALRNAETNDIIEILSNDPQAAKDIPEFITRENQELIEVKDYGEYKGYLIKKTH